MTNKLRILILMILMALAIVTSVYGALPDQDWKGLSLNFGTEMAGAVVTYVLLELFIGRSERSESEVKARAAKKEELIIQMRSTINDAAIRAVEELYRLGWLQDGTLRKVNLIGANLYKADLRQADLQGAKLYDADLSEANLQYSDLSGAGLSNTILDKAKLDDTVLRGAYMEGASLRDASLKYANLKGADLDVVTLTKASLMKADLSHCRLEGANLESAYLFRVNLKNASLEGANLCSAYLGEAYLEKTQLAGAIFNERTKLPHGKYWTPEVDLTRFTNPDHPDFYRPHWVIEEEE